ncbi:serine/threonine protein kinase [Candidatus Uabimicrobium amorphum]|uniref:non-specific serine/threonine protein kinase n=1 Tax=Uabimicrobium amorphum TaxID=2596890 RepID=A0A5S9IQT0_UABAM|nr:serine/threonine-protein kinase [Candidatus Uabimicrobium amorphum]BBM85751.1 protein kinase [Candidatus Uabimicrobium amorphum]
MNKYQGKSVDKILQDCANFIYSTGKYPADVRIPESCSTNKAVDPTQKYRADNVTSKVPPRVDNGKHPPPQNAETMKNDNALKATQRIVHKIGRYVVLRKIGEGNFGQVFLVRDPEWNRELALKIICGSMSNNLSIKRFYREVQAISQLKHPNIVGIYEVGQDRNNHFYTMDYICGKSLGDVIEEEKRLNSRKAAKMMIKVANAVHYAHQQNVIHRDIKPDNIMIDESSQPFLADFGLAKATRGGSRLSQTGSVVGTPAYMPPEQASGKNKTIDEKADIYSLGATLYEMVTGVIPFPGNSAIAVLYRVTYSRPTPPREINHNISQDLENIILKCLEKKKQDRYASAAEMSEDLERYLEGASIKATPKRKNQWLFENAITVVGGVVILTACMLAVFVWYQSSHIAHLRGKYQSAVAKIGAKQDEVNSYKKQLRKMKDEMEELDKNAFHAVKELGEFDFAKQNRRLITSIWMLPNEIESGLFFRSTMKNPFIEQILSRMMSKKMFDKNKIFLVSGKMHLQFYRRNRKNSLKVALDKFRKALKSNEKEFAAAFLGYQNAFLLEDKAKSKSERAYFAKFFDGKPHNVYFYLFKSYQHKLIAHGNNDDTHYQKSLDYIDKALKLEPLLNAARIEKQWIIKQKNKDCLAVDSPMTSASDILNALKMMVISLEKTMGNAEVSNDEEYLIAAQKWLQKATRENKFFTKLYMKRSLVVAKWKKKYPQSKHYLKV